MDSSAHRIPILNPNPLLKERDLLLFAPVVSLLGGSKFILGNSDRTGYSQQRFQSSKVLRFFSEVPTLKYSRHCSGSEGIYTPWSPNGYSLLLPRTVNRSRLFLSPNIHSQPTLFQILA
jgi:hypothetical protein